MADQPDYEPLIQVFERSEWKSHGAYFWDSLREGLPAWANLEYQWIGISTFWDQVVVTRNSPIHSGTAVYIHGPDISGPNSSNPNWIDNILYLGASVEEWL